MKPNLSFFVLLISITFQQILYSQTIIILQPDAEKGKDAFIHRRIPNAQHGNHFDFAAMAWTNNGVPNVIKSLIEFDLSEIPDGAIIISAGLSLYAHNSPLNGHHSTLSGSNKAVLLKVTEPWLEDSVTWKNQPGTTDSLKVNVPESLGDIQHYLNMDVTYLVQEWIDKPESNHGLLFQLLSDEYYRCLIFASSDHENADLHPKLEITYAEPFEFDGHLTLRPGSEDGKDAFIHSRLYYDNYGDHPDFSSMAWTNSGEPCDVRNLINFDLTTLPEKAVVKYASLSLYSYDSPSNGCHSILGGSNESVLKGVTSAWEEHSVTWESQPSTTDVLDIALKESQSSFENYLDIDATPIIRVMADHETFVIYGMLLKLVDEEERYRSLIFASSDHADTSLHPKLVICYAIETNVEAVNPDSHFKVYPNPAKDKVQIEIGDNSNAMLRIFDSQGRLVYEKNGIANPETVNLSNLRSGIYTIQISNPENISIKKLLIN